MVPPFGTIFRGNVANDAVTLVAKLAWIGRKTKHAAVGSLVGILNVRVDRGRRDDLDLLLVVLVVVVRLCAVVPRDHWIVICINGDSWCW